MVWNGTVSQKINTFDSASTQRFLIAGVKAKNRVETSPYFSYLKKKEIYGFRKFENLDIFWFENFKLNFVNFLAQKSFT